MTAWPARGVLPGAPPFRRAHPRCPPRERAGLARRAATAPPHRGPPQRLRAPGAPSRAAHEPAADGPARRRLAALRRGRLRRRLRRALRGRHRHRGRRLAGAGCGAAAAAGGAARAFPRRRRGRLPRGAVQRGGRAFHAAGTPTPPRCRIATLPHPTPSPSLALLAPRALLTTSRALAFDSAAATTRITTALVAQNLDAALAAAAEMLAAARERPETQAAIAAILGHLARHPLCRSPALGAFVAALME